MEKFTSLYEGSNSLSYSKDFYLKNLKEFKSKNGKSFTTIAFSVKAGVFTLNVPSKLIFNSVDNELPNLNEEYKKMTLSRFLFAPDFEDFNKEKKEEFFNAYDKYMQPIIDRLEKKKEEDINNEIKNSFESKIKRIIPDIEVLSYDKDKRKANTNLGEFTVFGDNDFMIGDVRISLSDDGYFNVNYKNDLAVKAKGKDGIIAKSLIKHNRGEKLNKGEAFVLKKVYNEYLESHDKYYHMADDRRAYKKGFNEKRFLTVLEDILKENGVNL